MCIYSGTFAYLLSSYSPPIIRCLFLQGTSRAFLLSLFLLHATMLYANTDLSGSSSCAMLTLHLSTDVLAFDCLWLWPPLDNSSNKICVNCVWKRHLWLPSSYPPFVSCEVSVVHLSFSSVLGNCFHISLNFLVEQRMWSIFQGISFQAVFHLDYLHSALLCTFLDMHY